MSERWKSVAGFSDYEVSDLGRVRRGDRVLKAHASPKKPYLVVGLYKNGKRHPFVVHRLVMDAFIGPPPSGFDRSHIDGDCTNNSLANLIYEPHRDNNERRRAHGTIRIPKKLSAEIAGQIRHAARNGQRTSQIAETYGLNRSTVKRIVAGTIWSDSHRSQTPAHRDDEMNAPQPEPEPA